MKIVVSKFKWFQFGERLSEWRKKRQEDELILIERAEERSISILQKRYGYNREQATVELRTNYSKTHLG